MSSDATTTDLSAQDDVHDDAAHEYDAHLDHKPDSYYVKVALGLALITALEVSLSYMDVGALFLPAMLILMAIKFVTVVSIFMHLKFDSRIFTWCFYSGLILALVVYIATLATFQFFDQ